VTANLLFGVKGWGISGNCGDPDPNDRIGRKTTLKKAFGGRKGAEAEGD